MPQFLEQASALCTPVSGLLLVKVKGAAEGGDRFLLFLPATLFPGYSKRSHSENN